MGEIIVNTAGMDCRGAGASGSGLKEINSVSITKAVHESGVTKSIDVGCHYLSYREKRCLVTGAPCPHLHPVHSY